MSVLVKIKLKGAREALDRKDFEFAREQCSQVLELDPANYNALVFLGLAEQNLVHYERSQEAYEKAIQVNAENLLAYQVELNINQFPCFASMKRKTNDF